MARLSVGSWSLRLRSRSLSGCRLIDWGARRVLPFLTLLSRRGAPGLTLGGVAFTIREARDDDAAGIVRLGRQNSAHYVRLAPEHFKFPDEEGLVEFIENDRLWREGPDTLALVAADEGAIAGYLEASLQRPDETARWQAQRDLSEIRLFINYVGTADAYKRQGVATKLVQAAEQWGREHGAVVALCDTFIDSPMSVPFWEQRMGYERRAIIFRKLLD
jgi:GNAT superfamily N-acetyltransferase